MGVSLNPDTFTKGGLVQDVDVEIIGGSYTLEPPEGYTQRDRVFVELELKVLDDNSEVTQYWSAGKNTDFSPSTDGLELVPTGSKASLNDNSNFSIFIQNLANCQFPKSALTDKLNCLFGTQIHVVRIPAPEREGLPGKGAEAKKSYILVPNKLIKLPGEKAKARGAAKRGTTATAAATTAAPAEPDAGQDEMDVDSEALLAVMDIMAAGKPMLIPALKAATIRKHIKTDKEIRNQIVTLVGDAAWLASQGFAVEGGAVQPQA